MKGLLRFLLQHHFILLFVILEVFSVYMVVSYNDMQKKSFLNSSNSVYSSVYEKYDGITNYFSLSETNLVLATENAMLRNVLKSSYKDNRISSQEVKDSIYKQQYVYIPAKIINNSTNKQHNFLTLNKGRNQGITESCAVVSPTGVIGIVKNVSANYSTVLSVLNTNIFISSKIKKNSYFGSLHWDGKLYNRAVLNEIPFHVNVLPGDTIITSGYSSIFPEGITIGTVHNIDTIIGGDFFNIYVDLSTDYKNTEYVYVIKNLFKTEQNNLEELSNND